MKYLIHSDLAIRLNLNPFKWCWLPFGTFDPPTPVFPNRKTIGFGWLFVQVFLDIDNGVMNMEEFRNTIFGSIGTLDIEVSDDKEFSTLGEMDKEIH